MGALGARAYILAFPHKGACKDKFAGGGTWASARDTPILAFPRKGLIGVGLGLNSHRAIAALARVTPILAFPHKGFIGVG